MPREIRRIIFTQDEATEALSNYGNKFNMTFPSGKVIKVNFGASTEYDQHPMKSFQSTLHRQYNIEQKPRATIVTFFDSTTLEHKYFNLTADFISSALIEYCIEHKIMLPKAARKTLDIAEFNLVLDIMPEQNDPRPGGAELSLED